jgi:GNAT superfamily N-acetyltransferase
VTVESAFGLTISTVRPDEAAQYARAAAAAFREAYDDGEDAANLALHLAREFEESKLRRELEDPAVRVLALRVRDGAPRLDPSAPLEGEWAGFVAMHADVRGDGVTAERPLEIVRFYLRAAWYGRGVARPLMEAALAHARQGGHDGVWLQVWEHNARARRFYEKCGFVAVGMSTFLFGAITERDPVYQLLLRRTDATPG